MSGSAITPKAEIRAETCPGSLFKAYPTLILRDEAVAWQESVFAGSDAESQARLLSVIHDFLVAQGEKKQVEKKTDLEALMGNHDLSEQGSVMCLGIVGSVLIRTQLVCRRCSTEFPPHHPRSEEP